MTYATEPGQLHGSKADRIECISTTSSEDHFATSTLHGNVVVWDITRQLKVGHRLADLPLVLFGELIVTANVLL